MITILNAIQSTLSIVIILAVGYILTRKGWFNDNIAGLFSKIVVNVSLPPMMIYSLMTTFDRERLLSSGTGLIIPFASMIISYIIGIIVARITRVRPDRRGIFETMFFASNTVFIGIPVNIALFGEQSIPYALIYYFANTTMFWTIGVNRIKSDGGVKKSSYFSLEEFFKIFSPPFLGFLVAVMLIILNIQLPAFAMDTCKYLGNLTTPLSLLFIGISFYNVKIKDIKPDIEMISLMSGRFIIAPLLVFILSRVFTIPTLMLKVFIIQASMPIITQAAISAKAYNADSKYASVMVTVSTILNILFIPIYMILLSRI